MGIAQWLKLLSARLIEVHDEANYAADRYIRRGGSGKTEESGAIRTTAAIATSSSQPAPPPVTQGYREVNGEPISNSDLPPTPQRQAEAPRRVSP